MHSMYEGFNKLIYHKLTQKHVLLIGIHNPSLNLLMNIRGVTMPSCHDSIHITILNSRYSKSLLIVTIHHTYCCIFVLRYIVTPLII